MTRSVDSNLNLNLNRNQFYHKEQQQQQQKKALKQIDFFFYSEMNEIKSRIFYRNISKLFKYLKIFFLFLISFFFFFFATKCFRFRVSLKDFRFCFPSLRSNRFIRLFLFFPLSNIFESHWDRYEQIINQCFRISQMSFKFWNFVFQFRLQNCPFFFCNPNL